MLRSSADDISTISNITITGRNSLRMIVLSLQIVMRIM